MEWKDTGLLLSVRPHGEGSAIIEALTKDHGRHLGVVRGGSSRKMAPILQVGSVLSLEWRARLQDHMGSFRAEPVKSHTHLMQDPLALSALVSLCALLKIALPEREAHPQMYARSLALIGALQTDPLDWMADYVRWEMVLLEDLGFGLDLGRCAVTGSREDLIYVSPKSGRSVSRQGAGDWADRLLPLSPLLLGQGRATLRDLQDGLRVTGHFLQRELAEHLHAGHLPEARHRMVARMEKALHGKLPPNSTP